MLCFVGVKWKGNKKAEKNEGEWNGVEMLKNGGPSVLYFCSKLRRNVRKWGVVRK